MDTQVLENCSPHRSDQSAEPTLTDIYYKFFNVVPCDTPALVRKAQQLRYQVYCIETGFEDPAANPGGLEADAADDHSLHSLLIHRPTGLVAGTVRLILPHRNTVLPAMKASRVLGATVGGQLPRHRTAEISRFSISKEFRRRATDQLHPEMRKSADPFWLGQRALPSITLGLMRGIVAMSREAEMSHLVAVVEPALVRLLSRMGIRFESTGEAVNYHGLRRPLYRDFTELLAEIHDRRFDVWQVITESGRLWPLEGPAFAQRARMAN